MTIRVILDPRASMRHEIQIGPYRISADASVEEGVPSSGPSPHDLYDSALGACKALTALWYAKRKNIPVEGIEIVMERDASQERAGIYRIDTTLTLTGVLSKGQREDLLRVTQKCPIHKLMTEVDTAISTVLSAADCASDGMQSDARAIENEYGSSKAQ
jgi:putative redox protein